MLFDFFAISESKSKAKSKGDRPLFDQSPVFFDECFFLRVHQGPSVHTDPGLKALGVQQSLPAHTEEHGVTSYGPKTCNAMTRWLWRYEKRAESSGWDVPITDTW